MRNDNTEPINFESGDYGKWKDEWYCLPPKCGIGFNAPHGNITAHDITEHDDGTITVSPSILITTYDGKRWHGYLKKGVWQRLSDSNIGE